MIGKITRGADMGGLVRYLTGPGRHEEHTEQRVIATSLGVDAPLGRQLTADERRALSAQLDAARLGFDVEVTGGDVWHLSLTNRADDRDLSDEEWADAVREVLTAQGFDRVGEGASCPWAAFRHGHSQAGNDHVHVAVSLVREDGTKASNWQDRVKLSRTCRELEERYGLIVVEGRTGAGATPAPDRAEIESAERRGHAEPDRTRLGRVVRASAAASADEAEFVRRLRGQDILVRPRYAPGDRSQVVGYSVAVPRVEGAAAGGRHHQGPVWYGGGRLAKDLSLPRLRQHWSPVGDQHSAWRAPPRGAEDTPVLGDLAPGDRVKALDRGNVGTITDIDPDTQTVSVHFVSRAGQHRTRRFRPDEIEALDQPRHRSGAGRGAAATAEPGTVASPKAQSGPGRETTPIAGRAWHDAARRARAAYDQLAQVDPTDRAAWAQAAQQTAGVVSALAVRLEGDRPGPLCDAADSLARSAQAAATPTQQGRWNLSGLAVVAAQATLSAGQHGSAGWSIVIAEMVRLSEALERAHAARGELERARELHERARKLMHISDSARQAPRAQAAHTATHAREGGRVIALDRGNVGTITDIDDDAGTVTVRFQHQAEGRAAERRFSWDKVHVIDTTRPRQLPDTAAARRARRPTTTGGPEHPERPGVQQDRDFGR